MKKIICSLIFIGALSLPVFSQATLNIEARTAKAAEEIKTALAKMELPAEAAGKIIAIETEFHKSIAAIDAQKNLLLKDREIQLNKAHVARREKLIAAPLSGRQMEDVIMITDKAWRNNKL